MNELSHEVRELNQDSCRTWLLIKSCSELSRMSSSPTDALAIAEVAQLWFTRSGMAVTSVNTMMSQGAIMTKFRCQAGWTRSLALLRSTPSRQNWKVLRTETRYNHPALTSRVVLRFGVMSRCPSAIAVRQTPAPRYRKVNRVKCLISFSKCSVSCRLTVFYNANHITIPLFPKSRNNHQSFLAVKWDRPSVPLPFITGADLVLGLNRL